MRSSTRRHSPLSRFLGRFSHAARRPRGRFPHAPFLELESRVLLAGNPTQLIIVAQPSQTAAGSVMFPAVTVKVADAAGLQTADTSTVFLRISQGPVGSTVDNATTVSVSAISGLATFSNLIFSTAGTYTIAVTDGTLHAATSSTFSVTAPAAQVNFQHPIGALTAGQTFSTSLEVDNASGLGHTVTTDRSTVTLTIASGPTGGTIVGTTTASALNGVVTFSGLSLPTAGTYRFTVQDGSLTGATSNAFGVTAGAASGLAFQSQPASAGVDATLPAVVVNVVDDFGNLVTTNNSTVSLSILSGVPSGGTLSGTTSVAAVSGVATFSSLAINTAGAFVLHASDSSLAADSAGFNITGAADHLEFLTQPSQTTANNIIAPAVQVAVEDALGHVIVSDASNVTLALSTGVGTLSGTTTVAAVNGVATFADLTLNLAGTDQLMATDSLLTAATSDPFNVLPAPAALTFAQGPTNVAMNSVMFPGIVVSVLDGTGALVPTDASQITLVVIQGPAGATMTGTTTVSAVGGQATFDNLTFDKLGTYTLLAYDGSLVTETSIDFVVTPAAAKLAFVSQPVVTSMAGLVLPSFIVRVTDASGRTITTDHSNVTLSIVGPTGATVGGTTTITTINGTAAFSDIFLTMAGKYTFSVSDGSLSGASSRSMTITPLLTPVLDPNDTNGQLLLSPMIVSQSATTSTLVGKVIPTLTLLEEDMFGNVITTVNTGTATLHIASGPQLTLSGTLTAHFVKGVATFKNLSLNTAGSYTIQADTDVIIPAASPYEVTASINQMTLITPVVNTMRTPAHSVNYAFGSTISLATSIGSLVASSGIPYTNGTGSESVRLVTAAGATLETGTVSSTGAVSFHFSDLAPGTYTVNVVYDGDANHTGARSPSFTFTVGPTVTTLTALPLTLSSGATITLTATVTSVLSSKLVTTGSVQFFEDGSLTPLATISISTASTHTAVFAFAAGTPGVHTYTAAFVANSSLNASTSVIKMVTVT